MHRGSAGTRDLNAYWQTPVVVHTWLAQFEFRMPLETHDLPLGHPPQNAPPTARPPQSMSSPARGAAGTHAERGPEPFEQPGVCERGEVAAKRWPVAGISDRAAVVPFRHPGVREHAPAERAPDARLLLGGASEPLDRGHGVLAVLLLGLDVDGVELERPVVEVVVLPESVVDHVRTRRTAGHLHLDRQPEGAEALLERRAAEVAHRRGGAERRRERQWARASSSETPSPSRSCS